MSNKRWVVYFATTTYHTEVIAADTKEEAEAIVEELYDNEAFMDMVHSRMISQMLDDENFGDSTEVASMFEDTGAWHDLMAANEWLGTSA